MCIHMYIYLLFIIYPSIYLSTIYLPTFLSSQWFTGLVETWLVHTPMNFSQSHIWVTETVAQGIPLLQCGF